MRLLRSYPVFASLLLLTGIGNNVLAGEKLLEMKTSEWTLGVADPTQEDAYYQSQRFVLAGMVPNLEWSGERLDGSIVEKRDPEVHDHVSGLADEFDIEVPQVMLPLRLGRVLSKSVSACCIGRMRNPILFPNHIRWRSVLSSASPGQMIRSSVLMNHF